MSVSKEERSNMPTFIILGASKSGTSSLYHYLAQHPDVFMSDVKEPNYFALAEAELVLAGPGDKEWYERSMTSLKEYKALFDKVQGESAIGEASPTYLHSRRAPRTMYRHVPDANLIVILRDPADRAYSHYCHFTRTGQETKSFREALQREPERLEEGWFWPRYVEAGRYYQQLTRYLEYFSWENIKVFLFRDFTRKTEEVYEEILDFLGVNATFQPDLSVRHNASGKPRSWIVDYLLSGKNTVAQALKPLFGERVRNLVVRLRNLNRRRPEEMTSDERRFVIEALREDIEQLEDLLDRDLSTWKSV